MDDKEMLNYFEKNLIREYSTTDKFWFRHHSFSNPIIRLRKLPLNIFLWSSANHKVSEAIKFKTGG